MEKGHVALFGHRDLVIQIPVKSPLTHLWMHRGARVSWGCAISRIDTITTHFKTSPSGDTGRVPTECPIKYRDQATSWLGMPLVLSIHFFQRVYTWPHTVHCWRQRVSPVCIVEKLQKHRHSISTSIVIVTPICA